MTNPDNAGGLPELPEPAHWVHYEDAAFTQIDDPTPYYTADQMRAYGEQCRSEPEEWVKKWRALSDTLIVLVEMNLAQSEREAKLAELCRTAPAGGDGQQEMLACKACECDWPDYLLREGTCLKCRKDSAPAGGDPDNLQLPIRVSVSDGRFVAESLRPSGDVAIDSSSIYSKSIGEDDAVPTDADSAPAGSGEVERMAKRLDDAREIEEETSGLEDTIDAMRTAAALLRKLQQGAE